MSYRVITHNGKPHLDEVLGIALLSIHKKEMPEYIDRVHPETATKMVNKGETDNNLFYIDCGMEFDLDKNVFDHHHSIDTPCSALLLFNTFFPHLKGTKIDDFLNLVSDVDTKGPNALEDFNKDSQSISYFGFTQKIILREFEKSPLEVIKLYRDGIISMIDFEKDRAKAKEWLEEEGNISVEIINGLNVLKYNFPPPIDISSAVKSMDGEIIDKENIDITYSYDKEHKTVRTLFRTLKGDKKVNFTKAKVETLRFCHQSGFLLKFIPKNDTEWKKIIKESKL